MNIVHKICDFLYFADTITPFEKGRLYAQEAAKLDTYNTNPENVRELIEAEGIERHWGAFINGVIQEEQRLAIESGRVYCDECSGYYMPHEH